MSRQPLSDKIIRSVLDYYNHGLTNEEIGLFLGISGSSVGKIYKKAGLCKQLTKDQLRVYELRQKGCCCSEISEILGFEGKRIREIARAIGLPFTEEEIKRSINRGREKAVINQYGSVNVRLQHNAEFIAQKYPNFKYLSGWVSGDGKIKLQCNQCKNEFEKSAVSLRGKKNVQCPFCLEAKREKIKAESELQRKEKRIQKIKEKEAAFWSQPFIQEVVSFCPICGSVYQSGRKYCSDECMKRATYSKNKDKRVRKLRDRQIDKNITLESLFCRDKGKCWICGEFCDFNDYHRDENGSFIVGYLYPSIDHVYPLSKGGLHSWANVKLAHHRCNTLKRDKVVGL